MAFRESVALTTVTLVAALGVGAELGAGSVDLALVHILAGLVVAGQLVAREALAPEAVPEGVDALVQAASIVCLARVHCNTQQTALLTDNQPKQADRSL